MDKINLRAQDWKSSNIQVFWGELAPCQHLLQIYESDECFMETLEGFAETGLLCGDSVLLIATQTHLEDLKNRLKNQNFNIDDLIAAGRYFPLDAEEVLSTFMVNSWPDEQLFQDEITRLIKTASQDGRKVRAFGEMVAVLWSQGLNGATVRLEQLWNQLHENKDFTLYCAYPKAGFTQGTNESMNAIFESHSRIIDGESLPVTEIYYKSIKREEPEEEC